MSVRSPGTHTGSDATSSVTPAPERHINVLLAGNPNAGKTTLFNKLTGMRQRVGNFPGVTVEKKSGVIDLGGFEASLTDLPGCYSLAPHTADEQVVLNVMLVPQRLGGPDLVIGVVDAMNVSRHLMLIMQIIDFGLPVVVAINRWDMAEKHGIKIDAALLSQRLGVPFIPVSATRGSGIDELKEAVRNKLRNPTTQPAIAWPAHIVSLSQRLAEKHPEISDFNAASWRRLLFTRQYPKYHEKVVAEYGLQADIDEGRAEIEKQGYHPLAAETLFLRRFAHQMVQTAVVNPEHPVPTFTRKLDRFLTHKVGGLAFFAAVMLAMFMLLFRASEPLVAGLETLIGYVSGAVSAMTFLPAWVSSLLNDGLIAGAGGVLTFLPQIVLLFLFIGILEDSGYMSRAACVMDRWLSRCGLNGKSMVPMLSSFACAIPGIMSARTIEQSNTRLTTMLVAPLISCSARLPVYTLVIGAVIAPRYGSLVAGLVLFAMHLLGLSLAFPAAWLLNRGLFKAGHQPLIIEMPDYSWPRPINLFHRVYNSASSFVRRAGTLIVMISLVIWALIYFPLPDRAAGQTEPPPMDSVRMEHSYLGMIGKAVQPVFAPAGYDWRISVGIIASFPAREVIVATLSVLYNEPTMGEEEESMQQVIRAATWQSGPKLGQPVFTLPVAVSLLVFIALCMQCSATLVTLARESTWKYAAVTYGIYTFVAWLAAIATYQAMTALGM